MSTFKLNQDRLDILSTQGHLLVEGGPGSGKTTIALLKAKQIVQANLLQHNQKILFLSFARATISRIEEQAKDLIKLADKRIIEINTYHGFCWAVIQSYGYLLNNHHHFKLLTPPNLAARAAGLTGTNLVKFTQNLLEQEGIISFDQFAPLTASLLQKAVKIRHILSTSYPYIIVDEFQDTDVHEWKLIQLLGEKSKIMALADLDQRIYDFRGASLTRIPEFKAYFLSTLFNLGKENNRSAGTDIVSYGDDLLTGSNKTKTYKNVKVIRYPFYKGEHARIPLKFQILTSIKRVKVAKPDGNWSIAVLVRGKIDTLIVSTYLTEQGIGHDVLIDPAGPSLAANLIASLMEPIHSIDATEKNVIKRLSDHIKGRKGDKPAQKDLELAGALDQYLSTNAIRGPKKQELIKAIQSIAAERVKLTFTGVPEDDWLAVRKLFQHASIECLKNVYEDARYLKLLHKGALLSGRLSQMWRMSVQYLGAAAAIEDALTQEHFSMATRIWKGIFVMNIHKCKGKEFDEVIIWEEYKKPIVFGDIQQGRLLLRVAVTRAKSQTTFLTSKLEPCILV